MRPTRCTMSNGYCQSYRPGHNMHFIHARHVGETPWGWRTGTVVRSESAGRLLVELAGLEQRVNIWHHAELMNDLPAGSEVLVHEEYYALATHFGWLNVQIANGVGPVPKPADLRPWRSRMSYGVVDLATGRGVDPHA